MKQYTPEQLSEIEASLAQIEQLDQELYAHFDGRIVTEKALTRQLVSFQANKSEPVYRWYKYKEAFSARLVDFLLETTGVTAGTVLDPFAGSGTTLFAASELGLDAVGVELLPIGQEIITTKCLLDAEFTPEYLAGLNAWIHREPWKKADKQCSLAELRITKGAYPSDTKVAIERYIAAYQDQPAPLQAVLRFALLCILEEISYTRKDGQYLRWDERSSRRQGKKPFNKGVIRTFDQAIRGKLSQIVADLTQDALQPALYNDFATPKNSRADRGSIELLSGSCLNILPQLPSATYSALITSPPYCNRYDYTRTYALELALLGTDESALVKLRQSMLSCTVENRPKDLLALNPDWKHAITAADEQKTLQCILRYLEKRSRNKTLNNSGIARMVRGYFYEMACVIAECARVLHPGAPCIMVNDNVRYAGAAISVDTILASIAEQLGFHCETILVLPNGKGNSSQQMGVHGRQELRKCVYIWRRC